MGSYQEELTAAIHAVRQAARITTAIRKELVAGHSLEKNDRSPVTIADYGAQALIFHDLFQHYPDIPAVGEEDASSLDDPDHAGLKQHLLHFVHQVDPCLSKEDVIHAINRGNHSGGAAGRFWSLDPIDGTKGFLRDDQYAIALALIENGKPVLGVLGCPSLPARDGSDAIGCLFAAAEGVTPFVEPLSRPNAKQLIHASSTASASQSVFCESVESGHSSHRASADIAKTLSTTSEPVRMDSQCKYAAVARGEADLYLRLPTRAGYREKIWDHAAGAYLVQAAGGTVTDIGGKPLDFSLGRTLKANRGVVASNGKFHSAVLEAIESTGI
ncbi:MAG: 3'(2'),5'-bisphosphate nucleotidase [Verrucomicrobiota bacterium]